MAQPAANLRVRISADLADIKQGLGLLRGELAKVKKEAAQTTPDTTKWAAGIGKVRAELVNLAGAYIGIRGLASGVQALFSAFDRADRIGEVARIAGVSTEALSRLAFAAKFSGVELEGLQTGFKTFNKELVANSGLIGKVGVEVFEAGTKNFRPTEQIILDLADVFASLPDGPERAALAVKLFGKSGGDLIPVLIEGRKQLEEYGAQADATGNTISEEAAAAAGELNDNLDVLKGTLTGVANETAKNLIPAISGYAAEAANAGQQSNFAAEGGKFLASVLKVVASAAIIVKNVVEAAVNVIAFLGTTSISVSKIVAGSLGKTLGAVAGSYKALLSGASPLEVFGALRTSLKDISSDAKAELASIRNGFDSMKSGAGEAASEIAQVGKLFSDSAQQATADTKGLAAAAQGVKPASQEALEALRKLLGGEDGKGGKDSAASDKLKKIREEAERLRKESEAAAEKIAKQQMERDERIDDGLQEARIAMLNATGRTAEAAFLQINDKWASLLADLKATGNTAGIELVEKVINLEKLDAQLSEFRARASQISSGLQGSETSISAQSAAGTLGTVEGERQINAEREKAIVNFTILREKAIAYLATLSADSPEAQQTLQFLAELDGNIATVASSMDQFRQKVADAAIDSVTNLFMDLVSSTKSAGDALKDFVRGFALSMAQIAARALATYLVLQLLDAIYPGLGKATAATMSAGVKHAGGVVGAGGRMRSGLNPMLFGEAPRYHNGGIAGLAPNEVPTVLERGEEVLTRNDPRHRGNGGMNGGQAVVKTPVVAIGDRAVADALSGAAGEDVILTHVRNNWDALSRGSN